MSVMDIFAERIKLLREERGLGVREAAAMMGISHSALSMYENKKRTPDIEICNLFADFYGVSGDYLLGRTNEKEAGLWRN